MRARLGAEVEAGLGKFLSLIREDFTKQKSDEFCQTHRFFSFDMKTISRRFRLCHRHESDCRSRQWHLYQRVPAAFSFPAAERVRDARR